MRNEILIVSRDPALAESLRDAVLAAGYVVLAVATSSRFAIEAALEYRPVGALVDDRFAGDVDAGSLAEALAGPLGVPVAFVRAGAAGAAGDAAQVLSLPPVGAEVRRVLEALCARAAGMRAAAADR